jgi:hypothetical protein
VLRNEGAFRRGIWAVEFRGEMETQMLNYRVVMILVQETVDDQTI